LNSSAIVIAMRVEVVLLPRDLRADHITDRAVVVFDVLRATTSIAAALAARAREIQVFDSLDSAKSAAATCRDSVLLCGEHQCLPPPGFDLGNSPGTFTADICNGRRLFLSTTNGTRALVAARNAASLYTAALVNAGAVAKSLAEQRHDVTLLCAGTNGQLAMEDLVGAGAVIHAMRKHISPEVHEDVTRLAERLFDSHRDHLFDLLRSSQGGQNILAAGLDPDIEFAARLDVLNVVPICDGKTLTIRPK
jgi:2-phosphosulfolactate phosphatase